MLKGKILHNKELESKSVIYYIMNNYNLKISEQEIDLLSKYIAHFGYSNFNEIYTYKTKLIINITDNNSKDAYICYDYQTTGLSLIENNSTTDFTNKERTDFIFTRLGKMIIQTYDNFNTSIFFNYNSSSKIKINAYRDLIIPEDLEPDDIFDFSDNDTDFNKILSLKNRIDILKLNCNLIVKKGRR